MSLLFGLIRGIDMIKWSVIIATLAVSIYAVVGWVYTCCPGSAVCGGCNAMNWERVVVVVFLVLFVAIASILWVVWKAVNGYFGPVNPEPDEYSTDNPDRDNYFQK